MKRESKQGICLVVSVIGCIIIVLAQANLLNSLAVGNVQPTSLILSASKTEVSPGDQVTLSVTPTPSGASGTLNLYGYIDNVMKARWTLTLPSAPAITIIPSNIGKVTTYRAIYSDSVKSNVVTITSSESSSPPQTVTLAAFQHDDKSIVTFSVSVNPSGDFTGYLRAYSDVLGSKVLGTWAIPLNGGIGSIDLRPSNVGSVTYWKYEVNGISSNMLVLYGDTIGDFKMYATYLGIALAVVGAIGVLIYRKT